MLEKTPLLNRISPRNKLLAGLGLAGAIALGIAAKIGGVFDLKKGTGLTGTSGVSDGAFRPDPDENRIEVIRIDAGGTFNEGKSPDTQNEIEDRPKRVMFPEDADPEVRREYTEVLNAVIRAILENDQEMVSAYRRAEVRYYPVPNLRDAVRERIPEMPEQLLSSLQSDSFTLVAETDTGGHMYEIHIRTATFQRLATLLAAVDHELRHVKFFQEGKRFDTWTAEEIAVHSEGIEALENMRAHFSDACGEDDKIARDLTTVIARETAALEHWRSRPVREYFKPLPPRRRNEKGDREVDLIRGAQEEGVWYRDWDVQLRNLTRGRTID